MSTLARSQPFAFLTRRAPLGRRPDRPRWERPAYWALLVLTAVIFLYGLGASGYANSFYSAAAQAGSESWKAFLFGSLDSGNVITVDKPPAALWPMALSVRLFGLGSWQILVPQALMGVATVAVLHASVRRWFGPAAGLLAGGLMAVTPVAALMFRFNNPDALLCLLCVCAVYCLLRAVEDTRNRWLLLCGVCLGFAFLVKTLQAWLIVPPLALVYLVCAQQSLPRRIGRLLLAGLAMVASAGWWVALAELWPTRSRPYIGGSQNNSFLELTLGYNGLGRITGNEPGSVGPGAGRGGGFGGRGGPGGGPGGVPSERAVSGGCSTSRSAARSPGCCLPRCSCSSRVWCSRARPPVRMHSVRQCCAWGGSLLITCAVFSLMSGIFHEYYTVALAPYIAAVVAIGAVLLWRRRTHRAASAALAGVVAVTAVWSYVLLGRAVDWLPWLKWVVLAMGLIGGSRNPGDGGTAAQGGGRDRCGGSRCLCGRACGVHTEHSAHPACRRDRDSRPRSGSLRSRRTRRCGRLRRRRPPRRSWRTPVANKAGRTARANRQGLQGSSRRVFPAGQDRAVCPAKPNPVAASTANARGECPLAGPWAGFSTAKRSARRSRRSLRRTPTTTPGPQPPSAR